MIQNTKLEEFTQLTLHPKAIGNRGITASHLQHKKNVLQSELLWKGQKNIEHHPFKSTYIDLPSGNLT